MMLSKFRSALRDESGQGMTEYIIIVALIAIAAIGVITIFGDNVRALFSASANALAGETAELKTESHTWEKRNISNFHEEANSVL
jgi:pilus assembly protein Flp/PilA